MSSMFINGSHNQSCALLLSVFHFIPIWESCQWISRTVYASNLMKCRSYKATGVLPLRRH